MASKYFFIQHTSKKSRARASILHTPHGKIHGPFFMPIATRGAVKNISVDELKDLGAEIILSNTYHLLLQPGMDLMKKYKGLHTFMNWHGPILTDSGGYQVFSLSKHRKITEAGVDFQDPHNGKHYHISPESAMQIQNTIGSDIIMAFDECPPYPCKKHYAEESLDLTTRWAKRCKEEFDKIQNTPHPALSPRGRGVSRSFSLPPGGGGLGRGGRLLFGIVQGSVYKDLRKKAARDLVAMCFSSQGGPASGWDGYAIGGVAVGEPREKLKKVLEWVVPELPDDKPRYLMGLGRPEEIVYAVKQGIDMFDCVIPTREARHGRLYLWSDELSLRGRRGHLPAGEAGGNPLDLNKKNFYTTINIKNAKFATDVSPINNSNLKQYTKAYFHHLFRTNELLGMRLATLNNLDFYLILMKKIRNQIKKGIF